MTCPTTSWILFKIVLNLLCLYTYAIGPAFLFLYMTDKLSFWLMHGLAALQLAWLLVVGICLMALVDVLESDAGIVDQNQNIRGVPPPPPLGRRRRRSPQGHQNLGFHPCDFHPDTCPHVNPSPSPSPSTAAAALISAITSNPYLATNPAAPATAAGCTSNQCYPSPIGGTETPPPSYAEAISASAPLMVGERKRRKGESECDREPSPQRH